MDEITPRLCAGLLFGTQEVRQPSNTIYEALLRGFQTDFEDLGMTMIDVSSRPIYLSMS
jgi:hypothetical protein